MSQLCQRFYWPGHWNDVQKWCRTCVSCAKRKTSAPKQRATLQSVQIGSPLQMVACDILGPLPTTATGNKYVLVIDDYFTRWMEAFAIPNQEAPTIAQKLVNEFFVVLPCQNSCTRTEGGNLNLSRLPRYVAYCTFIKPEPHLIILKRMEWLKDSTVH